MPLPPLSEFGWLLIGLLVLAMVIGCLRIIGWEYYHAVLWHNLSVECHRLRRDQNRRLEEMRASIEERDESLIDRYQKARAANPPPGGAGAAAAEAAPAAEVETAEAA